MQYRYNIGIKMGGITTMKPVSTLFPENTEECRRAYLLGYCNGYNDGIRGREREGMPPPSEPIETLEISPRAYNCLHCAGFRYLSEVAALPECEIRKMRNLGKITANEIALALHKSGITGTDWELFLL